MSGLPKGWVEAELGALGTWVGGGTPDKSNPAFWTSGTIPWVSPKDMKRFHISEAEDLITEDAISTSSTNLVAARSVLIVTRSGILKHTLPVAIAGREVAINQDIKALTLYRALDALYFAHQIKALGPFVLKNCTKAGTTVDSVDFDKLKAVKATVPPLAEQKRIVAKLDALNAESARARTELAHIETLVSRYKQAVLSKAFSGELTKDLRQHQLRLAEDSNTKSVPSRNPGSGRVAKVNAPTHDQRDLVWACPPSWRWDQIGNCAFVTKLAGFEYTKYVNYDPDGDLRVVKAENAGPNGFRRTSYSRVQSKSVSMLGRSRLAGGEVLVVFVGAGTGNVAVVPDDEQFFLGPNIAMARPDPQQALSSYLELFFRSNGGKALLLAATKAVAQPSLSMGAIRSTPVALPPLQEQHEIVRRIESAFTRIDRLATEAKRALELVGKLDEAILAKAFRGELVPQDENDEPAEKLLERIRAERAAAPKAKRGRGRKS